MYDYDDYEERYYEPSQLDIIVDEYKEKCKEVLLQDVKNEMARLRNENANLKSINESYIKRENEISQKERQLKYDSDNLKRNVETQFYAEKMIDTISRFIEDSIVWYPETEYYQGEKCKFCDKDRKISAKYPNGEIVTKACECAKNLSRYVPKTSELTTIKLHKEHSRYLSDRKFYLYACREQNPDKSYDYGSSDFSLTFVRDNFDEEIIEYHAKKKYGEKIGLRSQEECQKYCDWLNEQKK